MSMEKMPARVAAPVRAITNQTLKSRKKTGRPVFLFFTRASSTRHLGATPLNAN